MAQKRNFQMEELLSTVFVRRNEITRPVFLTTPLTSTAWGGDSFSTTDKTLIDLSAVFGAPAGIKAIAVRIFAQDSGSSSTNGTYFGLSPNNVSGELAVVVRPSGMPNDWKVDVAGICPCNSNGDVYFQSTSSGTNTMDVWIQIWGYWL